MNKSELIDALAARFDGNRQQATESLEAVLDTIAREVARGEKVVITGFGTFEQRVRGGVAKLPEVPDIVVAVGASAAAVAAGPARKAAGLARRTAGRALGRRDGANTEVDEVPLVEDAPASVAEPAAAVTTTRVPTEPEPIADDAAAQVPARQTPAKKAPAKKAPAKKAPAKKTPAKKTPAKKTPAKKTSAKKTPAKKTTAKDAPAKKSGPT